MHGAHSSMAAAPCALAGRSSLAFLEPRGAGSLDSFWMSRMRRSTRRPSSMGVRDLNSQSKRNSGERRTSRLRSSHLLGLGGVRVEGQGWG